MSLITVPLGPFLIPSIINAVSGAHACIEHLCVFVCVLDVLFFLNSEYKLCEVHTDYSGNLSSLCSTVHYRDLYLFF